METPKQTVISKIWTQFRRPGSEAFSSENKPIKENRTVSASPGKLARGPEKGDLGFTHVSCHTVTPSYWSIGLL
jgi:hypothetical protein